MRTDELRRYEMLQRVRAFGAAHSHLFPAGSGGAEALDTVSSALTRLSDHAAAKVTASAQGRPRKALARAALLAQVRTLNRSAKVLAEQTPGFDSPFVLPEARGDQRLLTTARVFRAQAEPARDRFIALGLPPTFLADLDAAIDEFVAAIGERNAGEDGRMASGEAIRSELRTGQAAVRRLHAVVTNLASDDRTVLAVWDRDRRVQRGGRGGGGRRSNPETPGDTPTTPAETAADAPAVSPALTPAATLAATPAEPITSEAQGVPAVEVTGDTEPHAA